MTANSQDIAIRHHVIELKSRLLKIVILFFVIFAALYPFARDTYNFVVQPLVNALPENSSIISTEVTSTFFTPLRLNAYIAFVLILPWIFLQVWLYVSPALHRPEKRVILTLSILSIFLFYLGCAVAYQYILPLLFNFFVTTAPDSVKVMTDMSNVLSFTFISEVIIGLIFQIPILMAITVRFGFVQLKTYQKGRRLALVGAFIISMIIAPDVMFQFVFAVPTYLMFEIGIHMCKLKALQPNHY